jgi:hypothetical protein
LAAFRLGLVLSAHGNRAFCRAHAQAATNAKATAQRELDTEGLDARWFNEKALENATGAFHEAVRAKIAAEKYYKKQRSDFLTEFPNLAAVLEEMIPGSTQDFEAKTA